MIIAGYEVPHAHIHVIPTENMGQLSFDNAARRPSIAGDWRPRRGHPRGDD